MPPSKSQVDRAGRAFTDHVFAVAAGEQQLEPEKAEIQEAIRVIEWWRGDHSKPLSRVAANLRHYAAGQGKPVVAQRLKRLPAVGDKLVREPRMKLSRMADIGGVRAVLPSQEAAYEVAHQLRRNWTITKFRDYVAEPKEDGYRALHLVNRNHGRLIEIQLRTPRQDLWANFVESLSRTAVPDLKFGAGPRWLREYLLVTAETMESADRGLLTADAALAQIKEQAIEVVKLLYGATDES